MAVSSGPESTKAVWRVTFKPMNEGGPYTIKASLAGYKDIVIEDVLFGDVWLCSGQSNMQFAISQVGESVTVKRPVAHLVSSS